jgi:hypothetical protein
LLLSNANSIINRLALLINRNSKCNTYCQHKGKKDCVPPTSRMPIQSYNMINARWNAANSKFTLQNVAEISNIKVMNSAPNWMKLLYSDSAPRTLFWQYKLLWHPMLRFIKLPNLSV